MDSFLNKLDTAYQGYRDADMKVEAAKTALDEAKSDQAKAKEAFESVLGEGEAAGVSKAKAKRAAEERFNAAASLGLGGDAKPAKKTRKAAKPKAASKPAKTEETPPPAATEEDDENNATDANATDGSAGSTMTESSAGSIETQDDDTSDASAQTQEESKDTEEGSGTPARRVAEQSPGPHFL